MAEAEDVSAKKKKFIMLVDGQPRDALTTGMMLQNFGYSVTTVRSAEEAIEFLSIAVPALVISDSALAGMSGVDLLDLMRQDPVMSKVPVIIQSSRPDAANRELCLEAGCILYLSKPVSGEDLYRAVQQIVERTPRKNVRVAAFLNASVDGAGTGAEFVTVISAQGMFIKTLHPRPVGSKHTVSFVLLQKIIRVEAVVLYAHAFGDGPARDPGMGMKFEAITPVDSALIQTYIKDSFSVGTPLH